MSDTPDQDPQPIEVWCGCAPGLETMLAAELRSLGWSLAPVRHNAGGVAARGTMEQAHRTLLWSGIATHVAIVVARFGCTRLNELSTKIAQLPWEEYLHRGSRCKLSATAFKSKLYHTGAIEERVATGLLSAAEIHVETNVPSSSTPVAGEEGPNEGDEQADLRDLQAIPVPGVRVAFHRDTCRVSIDLAGEPLFRRGYRLATAKAPLRTDLARALVLSSGWKPGMLFADPFAGAGTIVIEAARLALAHAPGLERRFALESTAILQADALQRLRSEAHQRTKAATAKWREAGGIKFRASDRDRGAITALQDNAKRAGVEACIDARAGSLTSTALVDGNRPADTRLVIATNPPFGRRIQPGRGKHTLSTLYQSLGHAVRSLDRPWNMALLVAERKLAWQTGLALQADFATFHGGLRTWAMVGNETTTDDDSKAAAN